MSGGVDIFHGWDSGEIFRMLYADTGPVARDMLRRGKNVESAAKRRITQTPKRVDTGRLRASIQARPARQGALPCCDIGTNVNYALMVHNGTGIYGPRGAPIVPRRARVLRWVRNGKVHYARSVRGMQPNPFLTDALPAARD